jgi:hypothetical protein
MLQNFFTGRAKAMSDEENKTLRGIMMSPEVQKEFCEYLIHTSKNICSLFF